MPYPCWIYTGDTQQEFIGIDTCAVDMLNALPTDKKEILLIPIIQITIVDLFVRMFTKFRTYCTK